MSLIKFAVCGDSHGDLIDPDARRQFLDFLWDFNPKYRIHLGDVWDFRALRKGASPEEKAEGIGEDFRDGLAFLDKMKPTHLCLGNHDKRIWEGAESAGPGIIREACEGVVASIEDYLAQHEIEFTRYRVDEFLKLPEGGPKFIHGYRSTMYPAKAHFENWGSCVHGHVHKPDQYTARHIDGGRAFSVGCLADLSKLTYADSTPAKLGWRNGFLFGHINGKTGQWRAWNVEKDGDTWWMPTL